MPRQALGYIRVSTDMQAEGGLSLDAQTAAIEQYCAAQGLRLVGIYKDVISGAKAERPGLYEALATLQRGADVLVVLKFDRLSRSLRHFCQLYEQYFQSGEKELVAIREAIRLDSSLGRALVSILLVFAQLEREATAERTREAVHHLQHRGYHHGKAPYGFRAVPAQNEPRFKVLVKHPQEQATLACIKKWHHSGMKIPQIVERLNTEGRRPPRAAKWQSSTLYLLLQRHGLHAPRPHNQRPHTDDDLKARIVELQDRGKTFPQIAAILNEQKWVPRKGPAFTATSVGKLRRSCGPAEHLSPRRYLERQLARMQREHTKWHPEDPFPRPGFPKLAKLLSAAGYVTPKGNSHWWPAQVQQLLEGRFDKYYRTGSGEGPS